MTNNPGMFEDAKAGELCDLELDCDGVKLTVHKLVVWNQSEVIKTACKGNFTKEGRTSVIQTSSFSLVTVKRMVEYMYLGDYSLNNEPRWTSELAQPTIDKISDSMTAAASNTYPDTTSTGFAEETTELSHKGTNSTPPTAAEALRPHLEMSMVAGYYIIPALEALALEKIKAASLEQPWSPAGFDELVAEVYPLIPHGATQGYLRAMVVRHLSDFPSNEVLFPDPLSRNVVSMLRLQSNECKKRALASTEQASDSNAKRAATEAKVQQLKTSLEKLSNVNRCRHCQRPFFGHIKVQGNDNMTCTLQCDQCNTKHSFRQA